MSRYISTLKIVVMPFQEQWRYSHHHFSDHRTSLCPTMSKKCVIARQWNTKRNILRTLAFPVRYLFLKSRDSFKIAVNPFKCSQRLESILMINLWTYLQKNMHMRFLIFMDRIGLALGKDKLLFGSLMKTSHITMENMNITICK